MHALPIATCVSLLLCLTFPVVAQTEIQTPGQPKKPSPAAAPAMPGAKRSEGDVKAMKERGAQYLDQCMKDWEPATHMSKKEWQATCRRVADDRVKFLLEHPQ